MKKLIRFFKNIYIFRKNLWNHSGYDAMDSMSIFNTSLKEVQKGMSKNVGFDYGKRVESISKTTALIDKVLTHDYLDVSKIKNEKYFDGEKSFSNLDVINSRFSDLLSESIHEENKDWYRIFALLKSYQYGIRSWWW